MIKISLYILKNLINRICSYIKNLSLERLLVTLPIHLFLCEGSAFYYLLVGNIETFLAIQKSILWNVFNIKNTLKKRKKIQRMRKASDSEIFKKVSVMVSPLYYLRQIKLLTKN